jgi:5-methylcytosine-specific restriction endonuclease McrA
MAATAICETEVATTLSAARQAVDSFCDGFDAALITASRAGAVVDGVGSMIRRLQAVEAAAVARVDECGLHRQHGFSSSAVWLAARNGTPIADAIGVVEVGRALDQFPATADKVRSGELSVAAARQVTHAAQADPSAELELLTVAEQRDFNLLREHADRVRQGSLGAEDAAARHARLRAARRFADRPLPDGGVALDGVVTPVDWAPAKAILDRYQGAIFDAARRDGRREPSAAYRADAVVAAICGRLPASTSPATEPVPVPRLETPSLLPPESISVASSVDSNESSAGAPTTDRPDDLKFHVTVLVDALALQRGWVAPGECCEIPGVGPVSVEWVNRLLPEAVATAVIHDGVDIRAYSSMTRHIPASIRIGLAARDRTCVVPGCHQTARLEIDHRHDHARGGLTTWLNLGHLCPKHHFQKSKQGARLERAGTDWLWWPPPNPDPGPADPPVPWRAPIGRHLHRWTPDEDPPSGVPPRDEPSTRSGGGERTKP